MKNILITGINGFVGKHLSKYIINQLSNEYDNIYGIVLPSELKLFQKSDLAKNNKIKIIACDITKIDLAKKFKGIKFDEVIHLAAISNIPFAQKNPGLTININVNGTLNIWQLAEDLNARRFLFISSGQVYGIKKKKNIFLKESDLSEPSNIYLLSKYFAEKTLLELAKLSSMDLLIARPFNHIGLGQSDGFVVPDFMERVKKAKENDYIETGNLDIKRDFLPVEDVIKAYLIILKKGNKSSIYNVCSGKGFFIKDILNILIEISGKNIKHQINKSLIRKNEIKSYIGSSRKIRELGWDTSFTTMAAMKEYLSKIYTNTKI